MQGCVGDCFYYCSECWPNISDFDDTGFSKFVNAKFPIQAQRGALIPTIHVKHNFGQKSIYELTLTTGKDDPKALISAIDKILKSKMVSSLQSAYSVELTKAGLPHIHAIVYSSRRFIDASKIKSFWQERFELKKVISEEHYLNYILKEKNNPVIIEYCKKHNILQFSKCQLLEELPADPVMLPTVVNPINPLLQENL